MNEDDKDFLDTMTDDSEDTTEVDDSPEVVEKGEPETAELPEATPAPETVKEPASVPLAALKAEREKRQRLEREFEELRSRMQQPQQPQPEPLSFYEDPESYITQAVSRVEHEAQQRINAVLDAEARETFPDYDEVMDFVVEQVQRNPSLKGEIFSQPNPAKAAYQLGQRMRELEAMQDPVSYRAKLKAEVLAEIEAQKQAGAQRAEAVANSIPPDLANGRSVSAKTAAPPDVFSELFAPK